MWQLKVQLDVLKIFKHDYVWSFNQLDYARLNQIVFGDYDFNEILCQVCIYCYDFF